jgi:small subunit ribosomal protein S1
MAQQTNHSAATAAFAAMLDTQTVAYRKGFNPGERVSARVLALNDLYAILDVQAKNEGLLPIAEVLNEAGEPTVRPGDSLNVIFTSMQSGAFMFALRVSGTLLTDQSVGRAFESGMPIEGLVKSEVNGGYEVTVGATRAFCPYSQIDLHKTEGAVYIGQKFGFVVSEYGEEGHNVVLSRRALLEKEREAQRDTLLAELHEGDVRKGVVSRLTDFGIFVDLGGIDGLIPLRELSWVRDTKPENVAKVGDTVEVQVREIDLERNRVSLSLRATQRDPWQDAVDRYPVGSTLTGKVTHIEPFGAFVTIIPGVEGLVPISKLGSGRRIVSAREAVSEGQELLLQVETIDPERRRIGLKPIDVRVQALKPGELAPGSEVEGIVEGIKDFGVFVRLSEEKTGLLHIGETDIPKGGAPAARLERMFAPGSSVKLIVKSIEGVRISLTTPAKWQARTSGEGQEAEVSAFLASSKAPSKGLGSLGDVFGSLKM